MIKVWSRLYYLTEVDGIVWQDPDYTANKIIKAVKGDTFNGYFQITTTQGERKRFDQSNVDQFMPILFRGVAAKIGGLVTGEFNLVPIPNSQATVADTSDFKTLTYARDIAAAVGGRATAVAALRWKQPKIPAHQGGTRDPQEHFENLQVMERPRKPVVLFDDVLTSGGQMIAAYRRLVKSGITPVLGVVIGRATKEQKDPAIGWHEEQIETEEVSVNWSEYL